MYLKPDRSANRSDKNFLRPGINPSGSGFDLYEAEPNQANVLRYLINVAKRE
jgi:hypothetical protein